MNKRQPNYYEVRCRGCKQLLEIVRDTAPAAYVMAQMRQFYATQALVCQLDLPTITLHLNQERLTGCRCLKVAADEVA